MLGNLARVAALAVGGYFLSKQINKSRGGAASSTVKETIEVDVPIETAYEQWTHYEDFPKFMEGVREVTKVDDSHLHWRADIGGQERQWDAEITDQIPNRRIAWRSTTGMKNSGKVTFHKISDDKTRIMLRMEHTPENLEAGGADHSAWVRMQIHDSLKGFKSYLEGRGNTTHH